MQRLKEWCKLAKKCKKKKFQSLIYEKLQAKVQQLR
jgi:ppGpp synthetase/RelA/SpoT-type nucleotidyltranferase